MTPNKMECWLCIRSQKDGFLNDITCEGIDHVDECKRTTDRIPKLSEDNELFWRLLEDKMAPGLFGPSGSFLFSAVDFIFRTYRIPAGQRPILMDRVLVVVDVYRELNQRKKNGNQS